MKKGFLLGVLILGVVSIAALIAIDLLLDSPLMTEKQVPSLNVNLATDTLPIDPETAALVSMEEPSPIPILVITETDQPSQLDPVIELIGLTQVVIPTDTITPTKAVPTKQKQPSPTGTLDLTYIFNYGTTLTQTARAYCGISHLPIGVQCTPPPCASDERYYCPPGCDCPGGCGTRCAMLAPGDPSSFGQVKLHICYLSEDLHKMTLYFWNTKSSQLIEFPIVGDNRYPYSVYLPPGKYVAFAWVANSDIGGGNTGGESHSLSSFLVRKGEVVYGLGICDWETDLIDFPYTP
ncbi:MAG: hypothetical protein ACK2T7_13395 [Anaerolineales bacterium]